LRHGAAQSRYRCELGVGEARKEPIGLPLEVGGELELFEGVFTARVEIFGEAPDGAAVPFVVVAGGGVLFGGIHYAGGEFAEKVHIFHEAAAGDGELSELGEEFFLLLQR